MFESDRTNMDVVKWSDVLKWMRKDNGEKKGHESVTVRTQNLLRHTRFLQFSPRGVL